MRRQNAADVLEAGSVARFLADAPREQPIGERRVVGPRLHRGVGDDRFDLGREQKQPRRRNVVERTRADGIARQQHAAAPRIEESKREIAGQAGGEVVAERAIRGERQQRIGGFTPDRHVRAKRGTQLVALVETAVEHEQRAVRANRRLRFGQRLRRRSRETDCEGGGIGRAHRFGVAAAVADCRRETRDFARVRRPTVEMPDSENATHASRPRAAEEFTMEPAWT